MQNEKWYLRTADEVFGPESREQLIAWAKVGRIQPGQEISSDNFTWRKVEDVAFLDMRFSIDLGDGNPRGPYNKAAADALISSGRLPPIAKVVEVRAPFEEETIEVSEQQIEEPKAEEFFEVEKEDVSLVNEVRVEVPVEVEKIVEKEVVKEVRVEVPVEVEKIVEKEVVKEVRVEVPVEVEKIVEKEVIKEVRVEVPVEVEKIVEKEVIKEVRVEVPVEVEKIVEKTIIDERRVRELESILDVNKTQLEQRATELADKDLTIGKLREDLERLPQAASEIANMQAAVYSIISDEATELANTLEAEKAEFEEMCARYQNRIERLTERRRNLLKRAGADAAEMTRLALRSNPEDPRTAQIRTEYEDYRRMAEKTAAERERKISEQSETIRLLKAEQSRRLVSDKDIAQINQEVALLREKLNFREKEILNLRKQNDELMRREAQNQQVLMARIAELESPSIGTIDTVSTNQSREARMVKIPTWMRLRGRK
ncbi:MAG: hypothetical protein J6S51_03200 [Kiritimatiellae bacterium]|nr:hypothetical protein [Kiritimatiellia bacterium]